MSLRPSTVLGRCPYAEARSSVGSTSRISTPPGAEASFREAIQLDPKDATANNHLWELMASRLKATPGLMKLAMGSSST